jgi:hypothetical protein
MQEVGGKAPMMALEWYARAHGVQGVPRMFTKEEETDADCTTQLDELVTLLSAKQLGDVVGWRRLAPG